MAKNLADTGKLEDAIKMFESVLDLTEEMAEKIPEDLSLQRKVVQTLHSLGELNRAVGPTVSEKRRPIFNDAMHEYFSAAFSAAEKLKLQFADNEQVANTFALALHGMGVMTGIDYNWPEARRYYQESIDILSRQLQLNPDEPELEYRDVSSIPQRLAQSSTGLALAFNYDKALDQEQRLAAGAKVIRQSMDQISAYCERNPFLLEEKLILIRSHQVLGFMVDEKTRIDVLEDGLEMIRKAVELHPESILLYRNFDIMGAELARAHDRESNFERVIETHQEMQKFSQRLRKLTGEEDLVAALMIVENHKQIATYCRKLDRREQGIAELVAAIALIDGLEEKSNIDRQTKIVKAQLNQLLGRHLFEATQVDAAQARFQESVKLFQELGNNDLANPEFYEYGKSLIDFGEAQFATGELDGAIESYDKAIPVLTDFIEKNPRYLGNGWMYLRICLEYRSEALFALGRIEEATKELQQTLEYEVVGRPGGMPGGAIRANLLLCRTELMRGNVEAALAKADQLLADEFDNKTASAAVSEAHLVAARVFAQAAVQVKRDPQLNETDKESKLSRYAGRSIELIRIALNASDFFDQPDSWAATYSKRLILDDPAFDAIRDRKEVLDLIDEIDEES